MGSRSRRSLWPKEHGAYGQLLLPLAAALAMGRPTPASALLAMAAIALFAAHEPLSIAIGLRGRRAQRDDGGRARAFAIGWVAIASISGLSGLSLADAWFSALPPLVLVGALVPFVVRGREKTTAGEVVAASALSGASLPIAVAGGITLEIALPAWGAWVVAFAVSTAAVRWVIARHKTGRGPRAGLAVAAIATAAAALLAFHAWVVLAALPMVIVGWFLIARPPHPRHLRRVGWTLAATSSLTAALVVTIVRLEAAPVTDCCAHGWRSFEHERRVATPPTLFRNRWSRPDPNVVIPANAGIHAKRAQSPRIRNVLLDSRFRGNDGVGTSFGVVRTGPHPAHIESECDEGSCC